MSIEMLFVGQKTSTEKVGLIASEDLWGLPLSSATKANLQDVAIGLQPDQREECESTVKVDATLENKLEIVKYVISSKQARLMTLQSVRLKQAIHDLIEEKEQEGLRGLTIEQLRKLQEEV